MVEHTRAHLRVEESAPPGKRKALNVGTLFLPEQLRPRGGGPLWIHFHGAPWLAERAAARIGRVPVVTVQLGEGSGVYGTPFQDEATLNQLIQRAEKEAGTAFGSLILSSWSAGYGAIREILRRPKSYDRVTRVLTLDSIHAGYPSGAPGPKESTLSDEDLDAFVRYAKDAATGKKRLLVTHSEVFPGTFASTTETADYLLQKLTLGRVPVLKWGPVGMQQLSEVRQGGFSVLGFAGNSAPDHVDHLFGLEGFVRLLLRGSRIGR